MPLTSRRCPAAEGGTRTQRRRGPVELDGQGEERLDRTLTSWLTGFARRWELLGPTGRAGYDGHLQNTLAMDNGLARVADRR